MINRAAYSIMGLAALPVLLMAGGGACGQDDATPAAPGGGSTTSTPPGDTVFDESLIHHVELELASC